ncbi:MAG TPA: hypothetical protein DD490_17335 [Acidobacteria bacterium]|nr:hypothetical protein [Acidobacteriota bacterium]
MRKPSPFGRWALAGLAALGCFFLLHLWVPAPGAQNSVCLMRRLSGLPCPGCGMTRAFAHLAKGEWAAAASDHLLAYVLAAELAVVWVLWGVALARGREPRPPASFERLALGHLAVLVAFWMGRLATGTLPW